MAGLGFGYLKSCRTCSIQNGILNLLCKKAIQIVVNIIIAVFKFCYFPNS